VTWKQVYESDAQSLWALVVVPFLVLVRFVVTPPRGPGVEPRAARFVRWWAVVFAVETIVDPVVTGPGVRWLGLAGGPLADAVMLPFVLLGDFRVFVLLLVVAVPDAPVGRTIACAAAWTCVVPLVAWPLTQLLAARHPGLPDGVLWLLYETAFAALALGWRAWIVPARVPATRPGVRAYLRMLCAYAAGYYALWAVADLVILAGADVGWGLRIVPNQLYYAFWLPVGAGGFFAARYAPSSTSVQASR